METQPDNIMQSARKVASILICGPNSDYNIRGLRSILTQMGNIKHKIILLADYMHDNYVNNLFKYLEKTNETENICDITTPKTFWECVHGESCEFIHILHSPDFYLTPFWMKEQINLLDFYNECQICCSDVKNIHVNNYSDLKQPLTNFNNNFYHAKGEIVNFITSSFLFRTIVFEFIGKNACNIFLKSAIPNMECLNKFAIACQSSQKLAHYI